MAETNDAKELRASTSPISDELRDMKPDLSASAEIKSGSSFSTGLQRICHFLNKSEREQQFDYEKLIVTFKYLQKCSLSTTLVYLLHAGVVEILGRTYDKLIQGDYGKREVLSSILELLYLIEDLSESEEGKAQCGKYFIQRLLALATTEVPSVNLHRAAVETLCAIITKSPANQQKVIDDKDACLKLFKQCLPSCGDFQLQASLTEIYYRLLKLNPELLDVMTNIRVRGAMEALLQQQKPDLLAKIKEFVILLNECMGTLRSVYTFLANKILLNGKNVAPSEEKLISFGRAHFSFYQTDVNMDGPTILDVEYNDILDLKSGSKSILEMVVQDKHNVLSTQVISENQHKQVRILVSMTPHDFSRFETHVLPKLQTQTISTKMGLPSLGIRKSSIGIMSLPSKESTLAYQPRNEAERYLPAAPRGILKKTEVDTCQIIASELEIAGKENRNRTTDGPARKKENFSEEPAIVKATPQNGLSSIRLASPCKGPPGIQRGSRGTELGSRPDARKDVSDENAQDSEARGPLSRNVKQRLNEYLEPKQGEEAPAGHQRSDSGDTGKESEEEKRCTELTDTRAQAFSANKETVGKNNVNTAEKENKLWIREQIDAGPQVQLPDRTANYQPDPTEILGNLKLAENVVGGQITTGYKSRISSIPTHEVQQHGGRSMKLNQLGKNGHKIDDIFGFKYVPAAEEAKQTSRTSGKRKMGKYATQVKAPSEKKAAESPVKKRSNQTARKNPTRRTTCKKPDSRFSDPKSKSDSDGTMTSNDDEEWAPGKENTDPIETESEQHKIGAAKGRGQRKGNIGQRNIPGKKADLPIRLQSGRSIISKGKVQPTSKVSAVQSRKTAHTDVYSFTSEEEERAQFKANITPTLDKNRRGKRLSGQGRGTTFSFTSIHDQPGKVRLVSRVLQSISQNKRQRVQKEDQQQGGEPNDNDVILTPKLFDGQHVRKSSRTDTVQKHSRIERWKSSTYTDHKVPESNVKLDESTNDSSETLAGEMSPKTGIDVNVPDTPTASADDQGFQVITTLIKEFKDRVKSETKRKMTDIVSHTSQLIQHGIEGTQRLIQKDVADFVQSSKEKYGHLNGKLEGQTKRMRQVYEKFQKDFSEHVQQYEKIVEEIDKTDRELIDLARKRGQEHKELFEQLKETSMRHLAEADQKVLSVTKASESMYGLKTAVEGLISFEH